jgi:predicted DNA-binding antitoxin AbrB/MazE fold protein
MTKILDATYTNGSLILGEHLNPQFEGKMVKVMILDPDTEKTTSNSESQTSERGEKLKKFLNHAQQFSFKLPADYTFNRDELYDR